MDAEVAQTPPPSGEKKREISNGQAEDSPPSKKPRLGPEDMGRVAEIVLVLSAMGRMRGGKDPTEAELALMAEAREKLALICETLAPKDIVANDAIERVIEDLGLKSRDQRLGFKVPKLSIAEKLLFTKRKMEDAKKYPSHAPTYASHSSQGNFSSGTENRGAVQLRFQSDKHTQPAVTSGGIPPAASLSAVSGGNSGSITYHFGAPNESKTSAVPSVLTSSHSAKDSSTFVVPKVERTQAVAEVASAGSSRSSILQGNSLTNQPSVSAPTWSVPTKSTSLANLGPEKNVTNQTPGKVQEASSFGTSLSSQAARDMVPRPYMTRTVSLNSSAVQHQPPQSVTAVPPSNYGNHNEIVKMVQKWLPPKLPEYPTWTPPSREYMNKALTCQICQMTVNDVESVLLCDACEKGYHLKCMHAQNQRGIPKVEWHCQKCLALSHGKPLPPKYGRVMRSMATSKMPATTFGVHSSSEKKMGSVDLTVNQQKLTSNETSGLQNTGAVANVGLQLPESRETQENNPAPMNEDRHEKLFPVVSAADVTKTVGPACSTADVSSSEGTTVNVSRPESSPSETKQAAILISDLENDSERYSSLQNPSDNNQSQLPGGRPESSISGTRQAANLSSELPANGSEHLSPLQNPSDDVQSQLPDCKAETSMSEARQASSLSSELPENESEPSLQKPSDIQSQLPDCRVESSIGETIQASNLSSELPANESEPFPSLQNASGNIQSHLPDCRVESSITETRQYSNLSSELPEIKSEHFLSFQNPSDNIQSQLPDSKAESSISKTRQASKLSSELPGNESEHFSSLQNPSDNTQPQLPDYRPDSSISETRQASNISSGLPENESEHFTSSQNPSDNNQSPLPDCAGVFVEPNENSCSVNKESEKYPSKDHTDSSYASAKVEDAEIQWQDPVASTKVTDTATGHDAPHPDVSHAIDWTSDVLEIVDGKEFYSSCRINGVSYKLKEHALFHSSHGKLEPSLLMAMWVDTATRLKWVNVTRCYFPGDLPENVGHPFTEANEVFESNHEDTFMAGLISGPCEVLPPIKYKEEIERRSHIGADAIAGQRPIFLCKWFYDEAKGHFQPISS